MSFSLANTLHNHFVRRACPGLLSRFPATHTANSLHSSVLPSEEDPCLRPWSSRPLRMVETALRADSKLHQGSISGGCSALHRRPRFAPHPQAPELTREGQRKEDVCDC